MLKMRYNSPSKADIEVFSEQKRMNRKGAENAKVRKAIDAENAKQAELQRPL